MNSNVVAPSRTIPAPWQGSEEVDWSEVRPGDVVLERPASCGACTVLATMQIKGTHYLSYYCCGGQRRPEGTVTVASPRSSYGIRDEKPVHPQCVCVRS